MMIERLRLAANHFGVRACIRRLFGMRQRPAAGTADLHAIGARVFVDGVEIAPEIGWRPDDSDPGVCIGGFYDGR
jgi:phosphate-selective porin